MKNKWIIKVIIAVALIGILFLIIKPALTGKSVEELNIDRLAQYLTSQNVTMYGTSWCSHCQNQKKLFGKSFKYIN